MTPIKVTNKMFLDARKEASKFGKLKGSILNGGGVLAGMVGEQVAMKAIPTAVLDSTFDHDLVDNGVTIDVKTKQTSVEPQPHYTCTVTAGRLQQCDEYVFVRVLKDFTKGWYIGRMKSDDFIGAAKFYQKGDRDDHGFLIKADCYSLPISEVSHA